MATTVCRKICLQMHTPMHARTHAHTDARTQARAPHACTRTARMEKVHTDKVGERTEIQNSFDLNTTV
jgi:hypothetical protein